MNLKNFKINHQKIWITGLLTLYLIPTTTLLYTFLKIIRLFFINPEISLDTVYVYQGGIAATMYSAIALFLFITAFTNGKFAEWLLDQKHITTVTRPKKIIAFICVFIILLLTTPKLIRFVTSEPVLSFDQTGIKIFKENIIPWNSIETISQGRTQFRHITITLKNGEIFRIAEPDMSDSVPTVLKKISQFTNVC